MKKRNNAFVAIMLAVSILVSMVPVYVNAGDSVTYTQDSVPTIGYNTNVIPKDGAVSAGYSDLHNFTPLNSPSELHKRGFIASALQAAIQGNTWTFSTTFNLSRINTYEGLGVMIARGDRNNMQSSFIRLRLGNTDSGCAYTLHQDKDIDTNNEASITSGKVGEALEKNRDYQLTMKISDGELLKCWLDGVLIVETALKGYGFTNVTPCFGWRINSATVEFKDCKMWEESEVPTIGNNTNVIPKDGAVSAGYSDLHNFTPTTTSSTNAYGFIASALQEAIQGNTWTFSTTFNLSRINANEGLGVMIARGDRNNTQSFLRLKLANTASGSVYTLHEDKDIYTNNTAYITSVSGAALEKNRDYQLTMKISDGERLQCWLDNQSIVDVSLKPLGAKEFTNVTPCFGWRINSAIVSFKNCQMWEDVKDPLVVSQYYDQISGYRADGNNIAPIRANYVFAGWFTDKECTKSIATDTASGAAYAKFVPEKVLTVKYQVKGNADSTANLRFVTTVDSRKLKEVGFKITFNNQTIPRTGTTVYKEVISIEGGEVCYNDPTEFSSESEWFYTYSLTNIPAGAHDMPFTVVACWETLDGTMVEGGTREIKVSEGLAAVQGQ